MTPHTIPHATSLSPSENARNDYLRILVPQLNAQADKTAPDASKPAISTGNAVTSNAAESGGKHLAIPEDTGVSGADSPRFPPHPSPRPAGTEVGR